MSNILRNTKAAPTVFIGDKQHDLQAEAQAEKKLGRLFPMVSVLTSPDGERLIPIQEISKIEAEYHKGRDQAYREGYQAGEKAGYTRGLEEARKITGQFQQAVGDAIKQRELLLEEAKQNILNLVIKISKKVTYDAVEIDREATAVMIARIIDQLIDRSKLKVKVHPGHLAVVEQNINRFIGGGNFVKDITFEADPRVRFGGCFIETPGEDIDARLDSQFEVIGEVLRSGEDET
ncbi:MAG: FliH/SctL family protein [Candidatus Zixiibacteriota bacterium]